MALDQQTPATTPAAAPAQQPEQSQPAGATASVTPDAEQAVGFGSRGRLRRRARFLRKARELAYRDLGGLVFSLHRFGQRNDELVLAKLSTLSRIDAELRALEQSLGERQPVTVLREAGITACPRCAAIHSGEDRFCPGCGLPMSRRSDLPIAGAPPAPASPAPYPGPGPAPSISTPGDRSAFPGVVPAGAPPATQAHALAQPGPPPAQPTQPFPPAMPATAQHATVGTPGQQPQAGAAAGDDDQPTEIIRPPAAES